MPSHIPFEFVTHTRRVQKLYKDILRDIFSWNMFRHEARIQCVLMRAEFEKNKNIKDPIQAKMLLKEAEEKFHYIRNPIPMTYSDSFGGVAWQRKESSHVSDWLLDYWHPLEKAQYPDYFARREQRKKEFVKWYENKYGRPNYERIN